MAKIKFTADDVAKMRPPEPGWHRFKILGIKEELSKDKQSTNLRLTGEVDNTAGDGSNIGRYHERVFSLKAKGFLVPFLAAMWDMKEDDAAKRCAELAEADEDLDFDAFIGKSVWNEVIEEPYENRMVKKMGDNWAHADATPPF